MGGMPGIPMPHMSGNAGGIMKGAKGTGGCPGNIMGPPMPGIGAGGMNAGLGGKGNAAEGGGGGTRGTAAAVSGTGAAGTGAAVLPVRKKSASLRISGTIFSYTRQRRLQVSAEYDAESLPHPGISCRGHRRDT